MTDETVDRIEKQAAEIERLGQELNRARYGDPDFEWSIHRETLEKAQAQIEHLHWLLAKKVLTEMTQAVELEEAKAEIERLKKELEDGL